MNWFSRRDYLTATEQNGNEPMFLDQVPVRFGMSNSEAYCHLPLLQSPYGFSTFRGN